MSDVVQKLWGFCHTLRHDGIDYGDYIEQITYLLFLKMADERGIDLSRVTLQSAEGKSHKIDAGWAKLVSLSGTDLTNHYSDALRALGQQPGLLGDIFSGAQSRFANPVNLKKLLSAIDETEWTALDVAVKAEAFEGLLEKAASEGKKGAEQYFTPRLLIRSIVRCMRPAPRAHGEFSVCDPACGTVLRLPNGTFTPYSPGTKTNVIFFTKGVRTKQVWIYDGRTNVPSATKKDRPLTAEHFAEFEACYPGAPGNGGGKRKESDSAEGRGWCGGGRWRKFAIEQVREREFKIDSLKWLKDESAGDADELPPPEELATEAIGELEGAVEELGEIVTLLEWASLAEA